MAHLLPHWNWEDSEAEIIPVYCYTNGDEVELFLNGKSPGRRTKGQDTTPIIVDCYKWSGGDLDSPYRLRWDVPYEPGELRVVAYRDGQPIAKDRVATADEPAAIELVADRKKLEGQQDLSFVTVRVVDSKGNLCPNADNRIAFRVEGSGRLAAVGNGDATSTDSFQANSRKAFSGQCLAIVGPKDPAAGAFCLIAEADGLHSASIEISANR